MSIRKAAALHGLPHAAVQRHREHLPEPVSATSDTITIHRDTKDDTHSSPYAVPNPGDDPPTAPRKVVTALVERRCIDLRAAGKPYTEIAVEVGISEDNAVDVVERVLLRTAKGTDAKADAARQLDVERLDRLVAGVWDRATGAASASDADGNYSPGQDRAVERVTKLLERRAKLLGLDAPTLTVSLDHPKVREELNRAVGELYQLLRAALQPHPAALRDVMVAMQTWRESKAAA